MNCPLTTINTERHNRYLDCKKKSQTKTNLRAIKAVKAPCCAEEIREYWCVAVHPSISQLCVCFLLRREAASVFVLLSLYFFSLYMPPSHSGLLSCYDSRVFLWSRQEEQRCNHESWRRFRCTETQIKDEDMLAVLSLNMFLWSSYKESDSVDQYDSHKWRQGMRV